MVEIISDSTVLYALLKSSFYLFPFANSMENNLNFSFFSFFFLLAWIKKSKERLIRCSCSILNALSTHSLISNSTIFLSWKNEFMLVVPEKVKNLPHRFWLYCKANKRFRPNLVSYILIVFTGVWYTICPTHFASPLTKLQRVKSWFLYHIFQLVITTSVTNIKSVTHPWRML